MKKSKAIKLLEAARKELDTLPQLGVLPRDEAQALMRRLMAYSDKFFDPQGKEHPFLRNVSLRIYNTSNNPAEEHKEAIDETKARINHCIHMIENFGLYKPQRKNMFETMGNGAILALLGVIGSGIFIAGRYFSNLEAMEVKRDLREVRDSLRLAAPAPYINANEYTNEARRDTGADQSKSELPDTGHVQTR